MDVEALLSEFNKEGDLVGLWQIVGRLREACPSERPQAIKEKTLNLVRSMIAHGFEAGDPPYSTKEYQRWTEQDSEAVVARVSKEWSALDRDPDIADIAWFRPPQMNN